MKKSHLLAGWVGAAALVLSVSVSSAAEPDGQKLLSDRCSRCHGIDKSTKAKKTRAQWTVTVDRMIGKGAKLNADEKQALIDYLNMLSSRSEPR